jgi:type I restriction enzyme S subunit
VSWPTPPLGSLVETIVPARDKPTDLSGPVPWVRIEDFDGKYLFGSKSGQGVSEATIQAMPLRLFPRDTVVCSCSCTMGTTAIVREALVTNQTFIGLLPRTANLSSEFLYYALQGHRERLTATATGAIQSYLSRDDFRSLRLPIPPLATQRAIADYLDCETARIDALVATKRRMVDLLEERRVATIARLVTPTSENAPGWRLLRLRYVLQRMIDTEHKTAPFHHDGEFLVIRTNNISRGRLILGPGSKFTDAAGYREWTVRGIPEVGDILLTREAPAGEACLVPNGIRGCVGQRTVLLKVEKARILAPYCLWALYGGIARSFIDELAQGSTLPHLNLR